VCPAFVPTTISRSGVLRFSCCSIEYDEKLLDPALGQTHAFRTSLSDIPEISFLREGGPDREPGDLVAGLFDGALDLLLLGLPSFV
jgi:hypothetical protein